jgi:thioredoxin-related protein
MKTTFFTALLFLVMVGSAQTITQLDTAIWQKDYAAALSQSKETGKPVLMVFSGSDWCKPCIMLREQIFVQDGFSEWAKNNVVCVCLDFPAQKKNRLPQVLQEQNESLAERFNPNGIFPLVVLLNSNETVLGSLGYLDVAPVEYIKEIEKITNKQ